MRRLGLVSVEVQTASAAGSTSIPGLPPETADALVAELARRAGIEEGT
jgi:membrane protein YdbS with pleckstrin-like domain